jgi:hypothetical protein
MFESLRHRLRRLKAQYGGSGSSKPVSNLDALASTPSEFRGTDPAPPTMPVNYVPSQQDERPRH